jgi:hypothetical protein
MQFQPPRRLQDAPAVQPPQPSIALLPVAPPSLISLQTASLQAQIYVAVSLAQQLHSLAKIRTLA